MTRSDRGVQVISRAGVLPRWLGRGVALVGVALAATLVAALPATAATVQIYDDSHVLDVTRVQNEAATLPDPVSIYTNTSTPDNAAFDRKAQSHAGQNGIVIAINTQTNHLAIRTGQRSRVSQAGAQTATNAFASAFKNNDYTGATLAALGSLRNATQQSRSGGGGGGSSIFGVIMILVVVLLVVAIIGVVVAGMRRRSRRAPAYQDPGYPAPGYGPQGYGPQGYGPQGYGPGYGRSGISPMAAGGIGAVAGGVLGYELGKMEGEREMEYREDHRGDGGGGYDGGSSGGGGADADFGGGSDSGGGGGDF